MFTPEAMYTVMWLYIFVVGVTLPAIFLYYFKPTARIIRKFFPSLYEGYKKF